MRYRFVLPLALLTSLCLCSVQAARKPVKSRGGSEEAKMAYRVHSLIRNAETLLAENQVERGEKLLASIPRLYPKSDARFKAHLVLGNHYLGKGSTELALKQFLAASVSARADEQAEAAYSIGICHYTMAEFDRAFATLRKVTDDFPGSIFANEAYYYIGLCHFKLQRWSRAVEALKKVGTSVSAEATEDVTLAEAGQRLYVRVDDQDLIVLRGGQARIDVSVRAASGDEETVALAPLGQSGTSYVGSIETPAGTPTPGNGALEIRGGDEVTVDYVDDHTHGGERGARRLARIRMVSTASIGFTDGAFREYTEGVFAGQPFFVRVRDQDADTSDRLDTLSVAATVRYKQKASDADADRTGVDLTGDAEKIRVRSSASLQLTETGPHTGVFVGGGHVHELADDEDTQALASRGELVAARGDEIALDYEDAEHIAGREPVVRTYVAKMLVGSIQDVRIEHREVDDEDLKARKSLIEAKIFLRLGQVFKDVGLREKAAEKADEGLELVEQVLRIGVKAGIDGSLVEEAFNVKWELLLVQDKLNEAIRVCHDLIRLFPNSSLADHALLRIGMTRMESADEAERKEATSIFQSLLRLPSSAVKAEAQFRLAEMAAETAIAQWERNKDRSGRPNMSAALRAYKACADRYPESPFAAESLDKISSYYIQVQDYRRAIELMEQVFQDYPDAAFLDSMLFKWAVAAYRLNDYTAAKAQIDRLLFEYPNSEFAPKAKKVQEAIAKKL